MDWFLYDRDLRYARVKIARHVPYVEVPIF